MTRPPLDVEEIRRLAAKGLTQAQIANEMDCTRSAICKICRRHGIKTQLAPQAAGRPSMRAIYEGHRDAGRTADDVAKIHGIKVESAIRVARTHGVTLRRRSEKPRRPSVSPKASEKPRRLSVSPKAIAKWEAGA